jgi:hypothetical protein
LRQITDLAAAATVPEWNTRLAGNLVAACNKRALTLKKLARVSNLHAKFKI